MANIKRASHPQFSLALAFGTTSGCCVIFALLAAIGLEPFEVLTGFAIVGLVVLMTIGMIELARRTVE